MPDYQTEAHSDPLASLHKMSTTAGLGSSDYVAINTLSIATLLLGLASGLAFPFPVLLILPVAGAICGIISLRQIFGSNGTQGGKSFAILGLLLSIGVGGYIAVDEAIGSVQNKQDEQEIGAIIKVLGDHIAAKEYDKAYALFDPVFTQRVTAAKFAETWTNFQASPLYGSVKGIEWNGRAEILYDSVNKTPVARGVGIMSFTTAPVPGREDLLFRKIDGKWQIEEMPSMFPHPDAQQGRPPR